jgi:RNA-directed DNA polymerase
MALNGLERVLREKYPKHTRIAGKAKVNVITYADDFIITASSHQLLENEIKPIVAEFLRKRGLELSSKKTKITHIEDGFDFLGQNVRKYNGKLLIKPAKKNVQSFLTKIRAIIEENQQAKAQSLIMKLNPVIKGWVQYHYHMVSKQTFREVDHAIYLKLWQWAKRRHPTKPKRWIKKKYFHQIQGRSWIFNVRIIGENKQLYLLQLFQAADMPIKRHIKIKSEANPYDPEWEEYFEERIGLQMSNNLRERRKLLKLWISQDGRCPICHQKITKGSGWNAHHIIRRVDGGKNTVTNLVLLHPNCHKQVHSLGWKILPPRSLART